MKQKTLILHTKSQSKIVHRTNLKTVHVVNRPNYLYYILNEELCKLKIV